MIKIEYYLHHNKKYAPFQCRCKKGTFGGLCDKQITPFRCKSYSGGDDYKCTECYDGYHGSYCQIKSCNNLNMCKNGGKNI